VRCNFLLRLLRLHPTRWPVHWSKPPPYLYHLTRRGEQTRWYTRHIFARKPLS
jgi:hypothetical protein